MRGAVSIIFLVFVALSEDTTDNWVDGMFDRTLDSYPPHSDLDHTIRAKKKKGPPPCNATLIETFGCNDKLNKRCGVVSGDCDDGSHCINKFGIGYCHCDEGSCNYEGECKPSDFCLDGLSEKELKNADGDLQEKPKI
jgi:hypothetical protein